MLHHMLCASPLREPSHYNASVDSLPLHAKKSWYGSLSTTSEETHTSAYIWLSHHFEVIPYTGHWWWVLWRGEAEEIHTLFVSFLSLISWRSTFVHSFFSLLFMFVYEWERERVEWIETIEVVGTSHWLGGTWWVWCGCS